MRIELTRGTPLRPYIATSGMNMPWFEAKIPTETVWYDPLNAQDRAYCLALNRANSLAHDGTPTPGTAATALGMPRWVQLDCCLLPVAMLGFAAPRDAIPADAADLLDPDGQLDWIAVSEYVALPTVEPHRHTGISMFSLVKGLHLGSRSKAMGLRAVDCRVLVGVTQYSSPGVPVHLSFGPLKIVSSQVAVHSRPGETFVYELQVPDALTLERMRDGRLRRVEHDPSWHWVSTHRFDPRDGAALQAAIAYIDRAPTWVIDAGKAVNGKVSELLLGQRTAV